MIRSWQNDVAFMIGDQKDRTIGRRPVLDRGAVGYERTRQISRNQGPEIPLDDFLSGICEIAAAAVSRAVKGGALRKLGSRLFTLSHV